MILYVSIFCRLVSEENTNACYEISTNFDITELQKNWCGYKSKSPVKLHNASQGQAIRNKIQGM